MTLSIAVVGGGPRGLWAVEELAVMARERLLPMHITVFDPQDLGTGAAYDPSQPDHRLVNVRSQTIQTAMGTFDDYRRKHGLDVTDEFPPRALVGRFLQDSWDWLLRFLPEHVTFTHERHKVEDLGELENCDEVLLVTGHEPQRTPDGMIEAYSSELDSIQPEHTVAVRGAALTFIDTAFALTVGRGGQWDGSTYTPSGREPRSIIPYSRSGRLIQVKPAPASAGELATIAQYRRRIAGAAGAQDIEEVICACATELAGAPVLLKDASTTGDPVAAWRDSLKPGRAPAQALGLAFRELYADVVKRSSFGGLDLGELPRVMEPITFGPPASSIELLLGLVDAGILDVTQAATIPEADVTVDSVRSAAGSNSLLGDGPVHTDRDGFIRPGLASIGRASEPYILGHDSLSRTLHDVIPRWARRVARTHGRGGVHGVPPLTGRREPWMEQVLADTEQAQELISTHSSPVNLLDAGAMQRNIEELVDAGREAGVDVRVFYARKANKALAFARTAFENGHGVDVASYRELKQVIDAGIPGEHIIVSAAVKPEEMVRLAIEHGAVISVDNDDELARIVEVAQGTAVSIAPRLAPDPATLPPTRFGQRLDLWRKGLAHAAENIHVRGVHVHLHGYSAADRAIALSEALELARACREQGHEVEFVDLGGGVPMSYLDHTTEWENYQRTREAMVEGRTPPFTWKSDPLNNTYPFHQSPVRGPWLRELLSSQAGQELKAEGLRLHLEPGRSVLDGCGMTLARVAFIKERSDGLPLVGLDMNRTQLRTTSDDCLIDPLLIRSRPAPGEELEAFLVGAYCIEDEVILRRRIRFAQGVSVGDIVAFPNTAGYFMHILESASHQIPLAKNVVRGEQGWELDQIDTPATH
ncbi:FAD/NAD(P)-binding protein [Corynebacterium tapiri]|uniref:Diaminopimelate decarboxylase n=1 Tax=Corynebacterium tapiri TaxID=1448266 RepID=A0A5C4U5Q7_9CORY|nr:FAD/NAD(P)-binding protein [Corynebacterium tapiri]TNL99810.1 diaminopimelate decarboxylase [Corynebacterium tapiri]